MTRRFVVRHISMDHRVIGERSDAVLGTAMPRGDEGKNLLSSPHPPYELIGYTTRSSVFHCAYLSCGSIVKGWHFSSPAAKLCSIACCFSDGLASRDSGALVSVPSRLRNTRTLMLIFY